MCTKTRYRYSTNRFLMFSIEMVYNEDCSGEGLISDWVYNESTYNVEECATAGGTHIYGRLATLEVSYVTGSFFFKYNYIYFLSIAY